MKATLDIPDDLYRRVKARSALEGRPVRMVAVQLFREWLAAPPAKEAKPGEDSLTEADYKKSPWLKRASKYIKPGMSHDMDDIREAIARGSATEYKEKLTANQT